MTFRSLAVLAAIMSPSGLMAQEAMRGVPPAEAMPLSEIIAGIESDLAADLGYIKEVQWDDDGYYEVEYRTDDDREVEMRVDPMTGDALAQ